MDLSLLEKIPFLPQDLKERIPDMLEGVSAPVSEIQEFVVQKLKKKPLTLLDIQNSSKVSEWIKEAADELRERFAERLQPDGSILSET